MYLLSFAMVFLKSYFVFNSMKASPLDLPSFEKREAHSIHFPDDVTICKRYTRLTSLVPSSLTSQVQTNDKVTIECHHFQFYERGLLTREEPCHLFLGAGPRQAPNSHHIPIIIHRHSLFLWTMVKKGNTSPH